jgi:superfamily II DNA or RNA helicase
MQQSRTAISAGQTVVVRDERWTVLGATQFNEVTLVKLRGCADANRDDIQAVLAPADVIHHVPAPSRLRQHSRRAVLTAAATALANTTSWGQCWTPSHARIDLRGWQLEPACAAVNGTMRILLADEVGLGKTIQAALIISELRVRGLAERVLVLTPASIREQWAGELRGRFGLDPAVFDQSALALITATLPPGISPWQTASLIISSIDLVKRPEVRAALESVPFDVLVVDEAHHLTPGTDRAAVVAELAQRIPWVVLATATPHGGDDAAFEFLQRLGDVGTENLKTFCRSRLSLGTAARRSRMLLVRPTAAERALLDATRHYAHALIAGHTDRGGRLVASVVSRRAASSAEAMHRTLMRRIALLTQRIEPERQTLLPWEEDDGDAVSDLVMASPGLRDVAHEVEWLQRLADLARVAAPHSAKVDVIRRLVRRTREPLLVFSEYRDVALLVAAALRDMCAVTPLHGGLSIRERRDAVDAFTGGQTRVLVATDAAGEGLNLQARCRLVVNVELPWTPRRLEQRIGRVDRLGQRRRVHAIHLAHAGSYEGTVIARLERRRARALRVDATRLVDAGTTASGAEPTHRVAGLGDRTEPAGAVYASHSRSGSVAVRLLYLTTLLDDAGRLVRRPVVAVQIERGAGSSRRLSRANVRQLSAHTAVRAVLAQQVPRLESTARETTATASMAMDRRLSALAAHLARLGETGAWQASLFDRRAERQAHIRLRSIADLRQHLDERLNAVRSLRRVSACPPQLIAAWLE